VAELDEIRRNTNMEPAVEPDPPPPMVCPACGTTMDMAGDVPSCPNADCPEKQVDD